MTFRRYVPDAGAAPGDFLWRFPATEPRSCWAYLSFMPAGSPEVASVIHSSCCAASALSADAHAFESFS